MLIAGILGQNGISDTANLVKSIFSSTGKKVTIAGSKNLLGLDSKRVKSYVDELAKSGTDILILKINVKSVNDDIFEYILFDIIIFADKEGGENIESGSAYPSIMKRFITLLDDKGVAIVNADDNELVKILQDMKQHIVTYGFNSDASITTSSIGDLAFEDKFMCSLQETIEAKNGILIEPQEYIIKVQTKEMDSYNVLAAASFAIVNGVDLNSIQG